MNNSLKINIDQFEELYRLSRTSYQLGKTSLLELLEVQDNLINSKIEYAKNKINLYQLISNYNWQIGQL
jgi:outer membrane protein TolC